MPELTPKSDSTGDESQKKIKIKQIQLINGYFYSTKLI
jgi:hypothetical protein